MDKRVLTRHPEGKSGVNISKPKYDAVREGIVQSLSADGDMAYSALAKAVEQGLRGFDGSIRWYVEAVKLDLEARGVIERVPGTRPQLLRLVETR